MEAEDTLATIIDFSLSRAEVEGQLIYNNLAEDPAVFQVSQIQILDDSHCHICMSRIFSKIFYSGEGC